MLINGAWKRQKLVQPKAQAVAHTISCNFWKIWHYLFDEVWMGATSGFATIYKSVI